MMQINGGANPYSSLYRSTSASAPDLSRAVCSVCGQTGCRCPGATLILPASASQPNAATPPIDVTNLAQSNLDPNLARASGLIHGVVNAANNDAASVELSPEALAQVQSLKARDAQVRAHEMAHLSAGAGLVTSGPSYVYQQGPDGQRYAVGGEVGIDTSPGRSPQDTQARAEQIVAAALAPADPSAQDLQVAGVARQMANQARIEAQLQARPESISESRNDRQTQVQAAAASPAVDSSAAAVTVAPTAQVPNTTAVRALEWALQGQLGLPSVGTQVDVRA